MNSTAEMLAAWAYNVKRLKPEISHDPVADALRKMAEQIFAGYDRDLKENVLDCCFCIHLPTPDMNTARTVINGLAVCDDHMGIAQGGDFSAKLGILLKEAKGERP